MSRLTVPHRERIEKALVAALVPDDAPVKALERAAYDAVFLDYYGAKTLKLFAAMPADWFDRIISTVYVKPSGAKHFRDLHGPRMPVPRAPATEELGAAARQTVDKWASAADAQAKVERQTKYRVAAIVSRASTLDGLLKLLPEAREILALPEAQDPDVTAAEINAALAARKAAPPAPPPPAKPARKQAAARKSTR
jgi:hypothetical protein